MTRPLTLHEDLDKIVANAWNTLKRPVFACAAWSGSSGTHFRLPGEPESEYRWIGGLWRFLSPYTDDQKCVKRVDNANVEINGTVHRDAFYHDLVPSSNLSLVCPLKEGEFPSTLNDLHPEALAGLGTLGEARFVCTAEHPIVIERGLAPFLHAHKNPWLRGENKNKQQFGLRFLISGRFMVPSERRGNWHRSYYVPSGRMGLDYIPVEPPGQYASNATLLPGHHDASKYGICERDPGSCIVCRGVSGERRHFGGTASSAVGLICAACFPAFASDILALLRSEW
jgi:hypothetical protein